MIDIFACKFSRLTLDRQNTWRSPSPGARHLRQRPGRAPSMNSLFRSWIRAEIHVLSRIGAWCSTWYGDDLDGRISGLIDRITLLPVFRHSHMKVSRIGMGGIMLFVCGLGAAQSARANCFDDAAAYQHVNPLILRAIAWQESHNHADAMHLNANGSVDYGLMQINTIHLPTLARYGISKDALMSPCKNVFIAAWLLRAQVVRYGNTWAAVGAYHSATPALRDEYARQIAGILRRWQALPENRSGAHIAQRSPVYAGNGSPSD